LTWSITDQYIVLTGNICNLYCPTSLPTPLPPCPTAAVLLLLLLIVASLMHGPMRRTNTIDCIQRLLGSWYVLLAPVPISSLLSNDSFYLNVTIARLHNSAFRLVLLGFYALHSAVIISQVGLFFSKLKMILNYEDHRQCRPNHCLEGLGLGTVSRRF